MIGRRRARGLFVPPRAALIPWGSLVLFVAVSPLLALLMSKNVVHGPWSARLHVLAGAIAYASALALSLQGAFNGLLARVRWVAERRWYRFGVYWVAAALVTTAVARASAPLFAWMGLSLDATRRAAEGTVIVSFYLAATFLFQRATQRIADEQSRALKQRAAALDARFEALQARTNPHFLFATLNSITSLIGKDPEQAEQLLGRLSTLLRYSIEGAERSHVSLREELEVVRDYLAIEQARFGERLRATVDVGDDVNLSARVPPMLLQPLVETAVLRGVAGSVDGSRVRLAVGNFADGALELVELVVDDDGAPADASSHVGTKSALSNLQERLRILYDDHASLVVGSRESGGFRARVTIPGLPPRGPSRTPP